MHRNTGLSVNCSCRSSSLSIIRSVPIKIELVGPVTIVVSLERNVLAGTRAHRVRSTRKIVYIAMASGSKSKGSVNIPDPPSALFLTTCRDFALMVQKCEFLQRRNVELIDTLREISRDPGFPAKQRPLVEHVLIMIYKIN
jgi:hypothetical protein